MVGGHEEGRMAAPGTGVRREGVDLPDPAVAQALSAPLRRRIFDLIAGADHPTTVGELTAALGCNHNAVRQHLARLREAGLVDETVEHRETPGRPRYLYTATVLPNPYARLSRLLLSLYAHGGTPRATGREHGRRDAAIAATPDPIDALEDDARRNGFAPRRVAKGRRVELVLDACPLAEAAVDDPRTVCALHRGLAEGLVEGIGGARVETFSALDPYAAGCRITLRRTS
jgi:predicted ArsR family transcriptional regulator